MRRALKELPLKTEKPGLISNFQMRRITQERRAESGRHPRCHFFSQLPELRTSGSSHECRPSQILTRSLLNPRPKPQMNPSCRSRGYQRVTLHAGIRNIIPLILDLGARLNITIDFDEASQGATALMPGSAKQCGERLCCSAHCQQHQPQSAGRLPSRPSTSFR